MCPNRRGRHSQGGSAVMVALFVIVIVGLLAAALSRLLLDSSEKVTVEVLGVRALMAAQSGLEQGLYQLYPNGSWQAALPDASGHAGCARVSTTLLADNVGLSGCSVTIACTKKIACFYTLRTSPDKGHVQLWAVPWNIP